MYVCSDMAGEAGQRVVLTMASFAILCRPVCSSVDCVGFDARVDQRGGSAIPATSTGARKRCLVGPQPTRAAAVTVCRPRYRWQMPLPAAQPPSVCTQPILKQHKATEEEEEEEEEEGCQCSDDGGGMDEASAMRGSGQAEKKMKTETYIFCTGV